MAYFTSLWKSRIIEQCRQEYENEKINSLLTSKTEIPRKTIMQKWRFYGHDTKRRVKGRLRKWFPDGSSVSNVYFYLKSEHAFPNLFIKSVIGFVGGIALTYLCFIFFVYQLSISFIHATIMSSIIGVLLTLGLAFSWRMRCLVYLLIPQMFSRIGRYTLTCYALVLILTGPATNTLRNSEVLTESMACSQEQIKTSVQQIKEIVKKPFNAMKQPIELIVERMRRVADTVKTIASDISVLVIGIGNFIQSAFTWLTLAADECNKKFDTPHDHCLRAALRGVSNFRRHLGNISWLSNPSSIAKTICRTVSSDPVCVVADYATASFSATLKRKLQNFVTRLNTMLFINIEFHHSHTFSNHDSSSLNEIAGGIVTEIRRRADPLLTWLSWSSCVTSLFLLLIIFRAKYYQHMFETRSRFDNRYVTKELRELDLKRYQEGRETVLPLNKRERAKYICITSFDLVAAEKVYLTRSMIFMTITTFKLLIHMVADYSLYWVLMTIRYHGNMRTPMQPRASDFGIEITGSGIVADFIRSIIDSIVSPLLPKISTPQTCLPKPHAPDLQRYMQIGVLIILLWFFALFEPYGLRFRHVIMGHYQPERAKTRALWLFNHILRTRGSFMKLARRKLHREYKYSDQEHLTFRYWIQSVMPCRCFYNIFSRLPKVLRCLLCNTLEESNDSDTKLTSCETKQCPGVYCMRCFADIGRLCTICLSPADYGDMSDVSLEKGSSDESDNEEPNCDNKRLIFNETEREGLIKKSKSKPRNTCQFSNKSDEVQEEELSLLTDDSSNGQNINQYKKRASYDSLKNTYIQIKKSEIIDEGRGNDKGGVSEAKVVDLQNETIMESTNIKNRTKINNKERNKRHNRIKKYRKKRTKIGKRRFNFNTICNKYLKELCLCLPRTKHYRSERAKYMRIFKTADKKVPKNYTHIQKRRNVKLIFQKRKFKSQKNMNKQIVEFTTCANKQGNCLKDAHLKKIKSEDDNEGNHDTPEESPINQREHRHAIDHKNSNGVKRYYRLFTGFSNRRLLTSKDNKSNNPEIYNVDIFKNKSYFNRRKKKDLKADRCDSKESTNSRNYRISTYIFDQNWIKDRFGTRDVNNDNALNNLAKLRMKAAEQKTKETELLKTIKKTLFAQQDKCICPEACTCKNETKKSYFGLLKKKLCWNIKTDFNTRATPTIYGHVSSESPESVDIQRRMDYYRSLGNRDFEDVPVNSERYDHFSDNERLIKEKKDDVVLCETNSSKMDESDLKKRDIKYMKIKDIKLAISERFLHLRIQNPLPIVRGLYFALLEASAKRNKDKQKNTAEKGVSVLPLVQSCSCQYISNPTTLQKFGEVGQENYENITKSVPKQKDVAVNKRIQTCSCATQCRNIVKEKSNSCIDLNKTIKGEKDLNKISCKSTDILTPCTSESTSVGTSKQIVIKFEILEFCGTINFDKASSEITISNLSQSSQSLTESKTDTVCSRVTINYDDTLERKVHKDDRKVYNDKRKPYTSEGKPYKRKINIIAKSNKAISTERAELCDVSTLTSDWWSPISERKVIKKHSKRTNRRIKKDKCVCTDGRIVTFRSRAQIIPSDTRDYVLSPSRYLLESQKYYNELFLSKFHPADLYTTFPSEVWQN